LTTPALKFSLGYVTYGVKSGSHGRCISALSVSSEESLGCASQVIT
jgi:hypothetical protein